MIGSQINSPHLCKEIYGEKRRKRSYSFVLTIIVIILIGLGSMASLILFNDAPRPIPTEISYTTRAPIMINGDSNFISANGVTSGNGTSINPYIIENWDINASSATGIEILNTRAYFIVRNNYVHNGGATNNGIRLLNVQNGAIDNNSAQSDKVGIQLDNSSYNNIFGNNVTLNWQDGIYLNISNNNTIDENIASNNSQNGIFVSISNNNTVSENVCLWNIWDGIYLEAASNNTINNNNCSDNRQRGIGLFWNSNSNMIYLNVVINNINYGASISFSSGNIVWNNTFITNRGSTSVHNPFMIQGFDDTASNSWDSGGRGNYWYDWTAPDIDLNGIVDVPYILDGIPGSQDNFPLTTYVIIPEASIMLLACLMIILFLVFEMKSRKRE